MRKFLLLAVGVALAGGTLAACVGGPPPPPPTDPHDVLVVGDSVAFSFGCVLGDAVPTQPFGCPPRDGYTTKNDQSGACTITPGTLKLYNGGTAGAPNCDTAAGDQGRTWNDASAFYVPKVVVINTAGWEVVDRWIEQLTPQPDAQWGGSTAANTPYERAAVYYSSRLFNAINMFRSRGAKVLVSLSPYFDPPEPIPPPSQVGPDFSCSWWEPYDAAAPSAPPGSECPGQWRSPPGSGGVSYRPSKTKADQFNAIITQVKNANFPGDDVRLFRFDKHFNQPNGPGTADDTFTNRVCPPPYDSTITAELREDLRPPSPTFGQQVWQCNVQGDVDPTNDVNAILARAPDNGHLSIAGQFDILQPYLESCVQSMLNIGGNAADCS